MASGGLESGRGQGATHERDHRQGRVRPREHRHVQHYLGDRPTGRAAALARETVGGAVGEWATTRAAACRGHGCDRSGELVVGALVGMLGIGAKAQPMNAAMSRTGRGRASAWSGSESTTCSCSWFGTWPGKQWQSRSSIPLPRSPQLHVKWTCSRSEERVGSYP